MDNKGFCTVYLQFTALLAETVDFFLKLKDYQKLKTL